ncbi:MULTISPECIES: hypothetical protein [unclassified Streptomyces]|uniref:hypothetical protein n=1 Tax=unclassified Streptomyces TaxID=2593676 RepID=UPI00225065C8|nr:MULTISPECIES: hypothetical protein [unclassified Streptomyces]MCX4529794.1 hypothetical protein [Streptomyces sp. NBC_01551]MCX4539634.1 hypothetical protein [Streptomyces sp. NBC_01565]
MNGHFPPGAHENGAALLNVLLASAHQQLGIAVHDRVMAGGGPPELCDSDLALDRMLAAAHRAVGVAVGGRLDEPARTEGENRQYAGGTESAADHPLAGRLASVRLKYRGEALRIARSYWPRDLVQCMRTALQVLAELGALLEDRTTDALGHGAATRLTRLLAEVVLLPEPRQRPAVPLGSDYLAAVEVVLECHAEQLLHVAHNARHLLDDELLPLLTPSDDAVAADRSLGADIVAQDLADDLEQAYGRAQALARAVARVERISSDFVGEDLRHANLNGVPLEGVRWDAATVWPAEWEERIRRASTPTHDGPGVLVVASDPHTTAVPADA